MNKKSLIIIIISIILAAALAIAGIIVYQEFQIKDATIQHLAAAIAKTVGEDSAVESLPEELKDYIVSAPADIPSLKINKEALTESQIIDANISSLSNLYHYLNDSTLWDIDHNAVFDAMATAMFDTLDDKYTYYVKAEESEEYEEETTGKYGGLGFYFSKTYLQYQDPDDEETIYCNITQVFPNTPSSRGGIKAGDMITHINGQSVADLEATDCAKIMKGEIGTSVTVTIKRKNTSFDITLTRALITVPTVEYTMLDNKIGYIQILQFNEDTFSKTSQALINLSNKGLKSLIIDLRDNPGGNVDTALRIANLFIKDSDLLTVNYKDERKNITFVATGSTLISTEIPMVVLVNGGTASSSEILSSTLKDTGRAVLVGTKTYGKGIMQEVSTFGEGWTSITVASFLPPSGNPIHEVGVSPDIEQDSIYIEEGEVEAYTELLNSGIVTTYVEENPEYTIENVKRFATMHPEIQLRSEVIDIVVRNEYYLKMTYDEQPIADTWFDPQIIKAVEVLSFK